LKCKGIYEHVISNKSMKKVVSKILQMIYLFMYTYLISEIYSNLKQTLLKKSKETPEEPKMYMSCVVEEKKKGKKNEKETYYSVTKRHVECRKIK